jgi:hypothetical protein
MQVLIVWWCHDLSMDEIHPMGGYNWKQLSTIFVDVISNWNGWKWLLLWCQHMAIIFNCNSLSTCQYVEKNCSWKDHFHELWVELKL